MSLEGSLRRAVPNATHVYRPDIVSMILGNDIVEDEAQKREDEIDEFNESRSSHQPTSTHADRTTAKREFRREEERQKADVFQLKIQARKAEEAARKEQEFQSRYADVLDGILDNGGIMGESAYALNHSQRIKSQKKKGLHDEWSTEVFDKIQARLKSKLDGSDVQKLEERLNNQMNDFLAASNSKIGIFLDAIDKSEYDPLKYTKESAVIIDTADVRDPLKRDLLKPMYEQQLMEKLCGNSPSSSPRHLKALGKDTLDIKSWGELKIAATPYGHAMDKEGNYIVTPLSDSVVAARKSHIVMDHYGYPNKDNELADKEMGKRGKGSVAPPGATGEAMSRGLFSLMQQTHVSGTAKNEPVGQSTGDLWLDAKGKAKMAGPEASRGLDLKSILHQTGPDPYKSPGMAGKGDWWLEAKGKGHPPGPEMTRGRKGLAETLQQTSNPYVDGRALGDYWLETKGKKALKPKSEISMKEIVSSMEGRPDPPPKPRGQGGAARNKSHLVQEAAMTTRSEEGGKESVGKRGGEARNKSHLVQDFVMTVKDDGSKEQSFSRWVKP